MFADSNRLAHICGTSCGHRSDCAIRKGLRGDVLKCGSGKVKRWARTTARINRKNKMSFHVPTSKSPPAADASSAIACCPKACTAPRYANKFKRMNGRVRCTNWYEENARIVMGLCSIPYHRDFEGIVTHG